MCLFLYIIYYCFCLTYKLTFSSYRSGQWHWLHIQVLDGQCRHAVRRR